MGFNLAFKELNIPSSDIPNNYDIPSITTIQSNEIPYLFWYSRALTAT